MLFVEMSCISIISFPFEPKMIKDLAWKSISRTRLRDSHFPKFALSSLMYTYINSQIFRTGLESSLIVILN